MFVNGRGGYIVLAASLAFFCACGALIVWRSSPRRERGPIVETNQAKAPIRPAASPPVRVSTIIDRPGDPVLVPRAVAVSPRTVNIALPTRVAPNAPKIAAEAFFVATHLVSTSGGYMGKFPEEGQEADAFAAQLAENVAGIAGHPDPMQADAGSDDDGGADTPSGPQAQILTDENSNRLEATPAAKPQLKQEILRTVVAEKIADLLIENGYGEESAHLAEAAAKDVYRIQTLPAQGVAVVVGALDPAGAYRVTQLAIYLNQEYVGAIALADDGQYGEAARPTAPEGLFDESGATANVATHFTLADGIYSAGLRNGMPEHVIREAIQLLAGVGDLKAALTADEAMRALYTRDFRGKSRISGKIVYIGLTGSAGAFDCYAFEGADGLFRCFDRRTGSAGSASSSLPLPPARPHAQSGPIAESGAISVHGILPPIKGAPVTSLFGMRFHPILHIVRLHAGLDFGAPVGSAVRAAADGKIEIAGPVSGYGNHVRIQHQGYETSYSHLSEIPSAISPGVEVRQGEIIAYSGNTGLSTGPHLHFEFHLNGEPVDPLPHFGAEIQAAAPSGGKEDTHLAVAGSPNAGAASEAEIAAFAPIKAEVDAALEEAAR